MASTAAANEPQFAAVRVGFAGRYKVGLYAPLKATLRGGGNPINGQVCASLTDSDGLTCTFSAGEPCQVSPDAETKVPLLVRFGHESGTLALELIDGPTRIASKSFVASQLPAAGQIPAALRPGQRLIVCVGSPPGGMDNSLPNSEGKVPRNVIAAVDEFTDLPTSWQGYEAADLVILSTSRREMLNQLAQQPSRIEALDQWVRMGGTLLLTVGENGEQALGKNSPLVRFLPGRYVGTRHFHSQEATAWETLAGGRLPIPPPKLGDPIDLPAARLADVQGSVKAQSSDVPLVVRKAYGLGQIIFAAVDLDSPSLRAWSDRPLLLAAILDWPATEPTLETGNAVESYGYDDLAGQLRSSLEQFRGVRLAPFFVVASLVVLYILLIGPGDYFLLRRLRRGMTWTWFTFPTVVVLFAVGGYWASAWLKRDVLRVNQVDLIDMAADGTARGASWFSVFSPRAETFDLALRARLPNGDAPRETTAALGWFGKAGNGFNGMYHRDVQNAGLSAGQGYSIAPALDVASDVPIPVWSCKSFVYRWLSRADDRGMEIALQEENRQPSGAITNQLKVGGKGVTLTHAYLAYDGWAYLLGTLRPGETVEIGSSTRRISLNTFLSSESIENETGQGGQADKRPYDQGNRDAAYVLRAMLFYDAANGHKRTGLANDYQGFADLSGVFRTGRAVLVAMPPQEEAFRGAELLRDGQPLSGPLDRHTIVYRFVVPVGKAGSREQGAGSLEQ